MRFLNWLKEKYLTLKMKLLVKKTIKLLLKKEYLTEDYVREMSKERMNKIINTVKQTLTNKGV
jgi:hypothetical protein